MPVEAPERIRVAQDSDGFWTCREAVSGSQEYVRADKLEELAAENERWMAVKSSVWKKMKAYKADLAEAKRENEALRGLAEHLTRQVDRGIASMDKCQVRDAKRLTRLADAVNYIDEANFNAKQELARNAGGNDV